MRLTLNTTSRVRRRAGQVALTFGLIAALGACGSGADGTGTLASTQSAVRAAATGPSADYPVVLGEPYSVDGTLYTPIDTMSYDEVGYAAADDTGEPGVTAAHNTLPLPSYVEITSLVTGKTILARVERRGPMTGDRLVALSPQAQEQLGSGEGAPVRVRRINPPEAERAKLRRGEAAAERMETPQSLVAVLKRKLPERGSTYLGIPAAAVPSLPAPEPIDVKPADTDVTAAPASPVRAFEPAVAPSRAIPEGRFVIQAATFSSETSARATASSLGGFVEPAGKYFRVRVGPFSSRGQADAALAKVRAAGYSDARVTTAG